MKTYNYLTKQEIDKMIAEYEEDQKNILRGCFSITRLISATLDVEKAECGELKAKGTRN